MKATEKKALKKRFPLIVNCKKLWSHIFILDIYFMSKKKKVNK